MAPTSGVIESRLSDVTSESMANFCREQGLPVGISLISLRAGRNSQVFRAQAADACWIIKHYVTPPAGGRDRLAVEFGFLQFCNEHALNGVPQAIAMDASRQLALYSFMPGERPSLLSPQQIEQAVDFLLRLNALRRYPDARLLPAAADACLQWQDHLNLLGRRLERLRQVAEPAATFVQQKLVPAWQALSPLLEQDSSRVVPVISPSDFGFHNCLQRGDKCAFVDFEYAGWDDPAKLACDFLCQPEMPVDKALGELFLEGFCSGLGDDTLLARVQRLLPLHRLKWCCILLNEFCAEDWQRRLHAGLVAENLLDIQFHKAVTYFERYVQPVLPVSRIT